MAAQINTYAVHLGERAHVHGECCASASVGQPARAPAVGALEVKVRDAMVHVHAPHAHMHSLVGAWVYISVLDLHRCKGTGETGVRQGEREVQAAGGAPTHKPP